jgi:hypothetical protein
MPNLQRLTASMIFALSSAAAVAQAPAAQTTPAPPPLVGSIAAHPGWPVAKPADVSSPEAILNAVYSVISGAKGQPRDWDRMRSLFVPDARLIPAITTPADPHHTDAVVLTIDGYINRSSARMASAGFYERSIHNEVEQFGNIVQVWSTYESRHATDDPTPFARGINSFQLLKDGDRYWVVNIFWDAESPTNPIPAKYLPTSHN